MKKGKEKKRYSPESEMTDTTTLSMTPTITKLNAVDKHHSSAPRFSLPQFDFDGLPSIPSDTSYKNRMTFVKKNTVSDGQRIAMIIAEKNPSLPSISRPYSQFEAFPASMGSMKPPKILDRDLLLECGHADCPDEVLEVIATDRALDCVDISCLPSFQHLYFLDLSGNEIQMEYLAVLPLLRELVLRCNGIKQIFIPPDGFQALEILDISYNTFEDSFLFDQLALLRKLRKLNLSSNNLRHIPRNLDMLQTVQELILDDNILQEDVFSSLNTIPKLRKVSMNCNFIERVPPFELKGLRELEELGLGNNKITYYDDLFSLKEYTALKMLNLWENPIVNRKKDVETTYSGLSRPGLTIILDGPIPLPSKYLGVSTFYTNKLVTINTYDPIRQAKTRSTESPDDYTSDGAEEQYNDDYSDIENDNSSSFFITETKIERTRKTPTAGSRQKKDVSSNGSRPRSRNFTRMYDSIASSNIKKISDGREAISNFRVESKQSNYVSDEAQHIEDSYIFDYNGDWFKLDAAIDALNESLKDDPTAKKVGKLYTNDFKSKKKMFSALKFALKNPISISKATGARVKNPR